MYWPQLQSPYPLTTIVVRGSEDSSVGPAIATAVSSLDRELPLGAMTSGDGLVSATIASRRLPLTLLALFAGFSIVLAAVGLAGVLSYGVTLRSREIGLRMALGAERRRVLGMVLGEGFVLAGCGVAIGVPVSLSVSRLLAHQLYGVAPSDPSSFLGVALLLMLVSLVAAYFPARRAIRVDPTVSLRQD